MSVNQNCYTLKLMRFQGVFILSFALFIGFPAHALAEDLPSISATAHSKKWLKLLHYTKNGSGYESDAITPTFYVSPKGRTDPEAELSAMLDALKHVSEKPLDDDSVVCRFPARTLWLSQQFKLSIPLSHCAMFEQFKNSLSAQAVSVVFSSYYLNNPSSAFGHTFLRLRRNIEKADSDKSDLLDYGINYAAVQTSSNAVIYALSGAFGWFRGNYTKLPFYYKIREYSDFESRDLWFYNLNFSQAQVDELVRHIWELGQTQFDYYFFSTNCSYQLMAALEAVNPSWDFLERMSHIVIPAATTRVLWNTPGLVESITYRSSNRKRFEARAKHLHSQETSAFEKMIDQKSPELGATSLSEEERRDVFDTVIDYYDFAYSKELLQGDSEASRTKQKFLIARAELAIPSLPLDIHVPTDKEPHLGHDHSRVGLQEGYGTALKSFTELNYRAAFHDLLDPAEGYPDYAEIQIMDLSLRAYNNPFGLQVQKAALVENSSLTPINEFSHPLSWKLNLGMDRLSELDCPNCLAGQILIGGGVTVEPLPKFLYSYFLFNTEGTWATGFVGSKLRLGIGPTLGVHLQFSDQINALAEETALYLVDFQPNTLYKTRVDLRYSPSDYRSFGVSYSLTNLENQFGFAYYVYF